MDASGEPKCRYDVFLNFRGIDTRQSFTGSLCNALHQNGLNPYMDDERLEMGDQLSDSLLRAIEESRISIVVLSKNYASSAWCLEELVKILETKKTKDQLVWPIFYEVVPSDVGHQTNDFCKAMAVLEQWFEKNSEKMNKWRSALSEVAKIDKEGWTFKTGDYVFELIEEILKRATDELCPEQLDVGEHIIGHQSRIKKVKSLLDIESGDTVHMIGIHGIGGMGKTTLAKALYNLISHRFECAIFLESVRERSNDAMRLIDLQERLLCRLSKRENIKLISVSEGVIKIHNKLRGKRVLLVLDDVDHVEQLEKLAGVCNWFGSGSRIIITTRDKHPLIVQGVEKIYEMKKLKKHEALQLFCWKAFQMSQPKPNFENISNRAVRYAKGLPLALKVIGSNLFGKSVLECESAMEQYERIPNKEILGILKISYDCLEGNAKDVFLDIACFFKGNKVECVEKVLDKSHLSATYNIKLLVDRSLLTIQFGRLWMHDLIQDMGKEVVRLEAPKKPGKRSRLFFHEDVVSVLTKNSGSSNIEGIVLDPPELKEVDWSGTAFKKMNNLRILIVRNTRFSCGPIYLPESLRLLEWEGYPSESLPNIPRSIVVLNLNNSHLKLENTKPFPKLEHLTYLNFSGCHCITYIPDVSAVPNLRELTLDSCEKPISVHPSIGFLKKLVVLSANYCKLESFLPDMSLPSLESLNLSGASIERFPNIVGVMDKPLTIDLNWSNITELPASIGNLTGLETLRAHTCTSLRDLPSDLFSLPNIKEFYLSGTPVNIRESYRRFRISHVGAATGQTNLRTFYFARSGLTDEDLHVILECFPGLEDLNVSENNFESLPAEITESASLRRLDVTGCRKLKNIPGLPSSIERVDVTRCPSLTPETFQTLWSQASRKVSILEVQMPPTEIPNWFHHRCKGDTLSFWARRKFPIVAFTFMFISNGPVEISWVGHARIKLYVNDVHVPGFTAIYELRNVGDQVLLCDLRTVFFSAKKWKILDASLGSEWKHVEVKCVPPFDLPLTVSECGAHAFEQETNMEDIQFECPESLKQKTSPSQEQLNKRIRGGGKRKRKSRWWNDQV